MLRCLLLCSLIIIHNFECLVSIRVPVDTENRKNEPPDHMIPSTDHENIPDPKYVPGNWQKPLKNRPKLNFTPQRLYSQVRRSSSVKKIPREEALRRAETEIEKEEAKRLKESVTDKKINTFYTEEGFEDAAYDHAGHIRDADFKENHENAQKKERVKGLERKEEKESDDSAESEEEPKKFYSSWEESGESPEFRRKRGQYDKIMYPRRNSGYESARLETENEINLLEKDIEREEKEAAKGAETEVPENLKELKDTDYDDEEFGKKDEDYEDVDDSDEDSLEEKGSKFRIVAAEHPGDFSPYVGSVYSTESSKFKEQAGKEQILVVNSPKFGFDKSDKSSFGFDRVEKPNFGFEKKEKVKEYQGEKPNFEFERAERRKESPERSEENYVYPTLAEIYEKWKRRGVEHMYETSVESAEDRKDEDLDKKVNKIDTKPKKSYFVIVRPKKINGTNSNKKSEINNNTKLEQVFSTTESVQETSKPNSRYLRKIKDKLVGMTKMVPPSRISRSEYADYQNRGIQPQTSHQLRFGGSRPRYLVTNQKGDSEKVLNKRFISRKFVIVRKKREGVFSAPIVVDEVLDRELGERFSEDEDQGSESQEEKDEEEEEDGEKVEVEVPEFNYAEVVAQNNEYKNATDANDDVEKVDDQKYPFYNMMEHDTALKYVVNPHLVPQKTLGGLEFYESRDKYMTCDDVEPELEETPKEGDENAPRLIGLGDKLLCLKEKYFDEEPLDNPLFVEKQIEAPTVPTELDPGILRARIEGLTDEEENSLRRMDLRSVESRVEESDTENWNNHAKKYRKKKKKNVSPYQKEVYDDVMGTIKNLATMYKGVHVLSTRAPPKKRRQESREKNDQVRISSQIRRKVRHPKLGGYRTNRVSYRTRPMTALKGKDGKVVGFFKTVRVHKRDLGAVEAVEAFDSRRIRPEVQLGVQTRVLPEIQTGVQSRVKVVEDGKNSRPRGAVRFGRFDSAGIGKRNEPKYTAVRKFDEVLGDKVKGVDRYDVHEEVQEKEEEKKEIYKPAANENTENEEEEEGNEEAEEEYEGKEDDGEKEGDGEEEGNEEGDESHYEESGSKSEEEEEPPYDDAEKNFAAVSEGEKEFERFSSRPYSSYESYYDPKYADLGPRVNKPAFHHPSFDSSEEKKKDSEESEEGYVFPWHEDEEDASEESRRHERYTGRHEFPWDRRDRRRREKYGWSPSESKNYYRKVYPWERYSVPWKYGGRRTENFWPEEGPKYPKSKYKFKKLVGTTSKPQIPATEEVEKIEPTTPVITTTPIIYTISPRARRPVTQRTIDQVRAQSSPKVVKTIPDKKSRGTIKARNSTANAEARFRATTPSSRKVEHRSKVSKEEIITMSFPEMEEVKAPNSSGKMVQKVSIVTKETPEHIYRTEEIDKNGVKDTIISVIPNNRTGSESIDRYDINSNDGRNNDSEHTLGISLPDKNLQLTEHGTRKVISSISWIKEDFDY